MAAEGVKNKAFFLRSGEQVLHNQGSLGIEKDKETGATNTNEVIGFAAAKLLGQ